MENIGLGVQFVTFATGVVTTIIVSWIPGILEITKERRRVKLQQKQREEEKQILIMELLDEFHSLNFNYSPQLEGHTSDFVEAQEIMRDFMGIIAKKQNQAKEIDFTVYKILFDIKKVIREFLGLELQAIEEIGESGYPETVDEYPPLGWLEQYNNIIEKFKKIKSELKPFD